MPAYVDRGVLDFINTSEHELLAALHLAYSADGFVSQYTSQTLAWQRCLPEIKEGLTNARKANLDLSEWRILLELPLYRLRRRIDVVLVTPAAVAVIEIKTNSEDFVATDRRQVEEYALDLRDFHEFSAEIPILPVLWSTAAGPSANYIGSLKNGVHAPVVEIGANQFGYLVRTLASICAYSPRCVSENWPNGSYRPVPSVIEAATAIFSGHSVTAMARADAENLRDAATTIVEIIRRCRREKKRALVFLTGVPGSGKTLAGLEVVHRATDSAKGEIQDKVVYLSGNTPLVTVLREALAEDKYRKKQRAGDHTIRMSEVRAQVRSKIQHIMDFLREYLSDPLERPPVERAIIFDEAQRAWDEAYGRQKFGRAASEPRILLDIMGRHKDWCAIVGLIGGGQEINSGENGMREWGNALRSLSPEARGEWLLFGPPRMADGDQASAYLGLGDLSDVAVEEVNDLTLTVPLRSFRSPHVASWVAAVLDGDPFRAAGLMEEIGQFPIYLTRDPTAAEAWLLAQGRGERRFGLVSSSSAARLRAYGYGVSLNATQGIDIAHWYLKPRGDVRSSLALEVMANEYTTQGLELDFVGVCWGGDLLMAAGGWSTRKFSGTSWSVARGDRRRFILNSYRVLLTRAREGLVIWVPTGDHADPTRDPAGYADTAAYLLKCGVKELPPI